MRRLRYFLALAFLALGGSVQVPGQERDKLPAKVRELIVQLEKDLPEYEKAADGFEKELQPFAGTADPKVLAAVESVRLQIEAIRSIRRMIAEQPGYLQYHIGPNHLPRWKEGAAYFLECAKSGKDAFAGTVHGTRPFRSKIDGQLLLYHYTLPKDYDPAKKYPLVVELHAGSGFTWLAYWVMGKPDSTPRSATNDGAIHIRPAGRQHVGMGEPDILTAIADAQKNLPADVDRVLIGGASWGGTGGFHFGTLLPDHFAAAWSLTGGGNYAVPVGNGRFDAYLLGDNLAALPFLIWDTPGDGHWKANHAFADGLRERAAKYPGSYPHLELTDPRGGHGIIDRKLLDEGRAWMLKQVRNRYPSRVIYKTWCLRYDGAYWARLDTVADPAAPARIEAELAKDGTCRVALENADRFHLDLAGPLTGDAKEIAVRVNDGEALKVPAGRTAYFRKSDGRWQVSSERYPQGLVKKHGVSGPIQDVFMEHPVLMVYGTTEAREPAAVTRMLDGIVNRLVSTGDGSGVLRTGFERRADTAVRDADLAAKNLILVGTPKQNRLLARIADRLPVTFLDDGVKIAGKEHRGADVSLALVYPNPLNPERYVLLLPEFYPGTKPWDYPDYVVFRAPKDGKGNPYILAKGTFDARWQLPER
jgi:hypothetical protein